MLEAMLIYKYVTMKLYDGARHEILNEINRKEVYEDIIRWLNGLNELVDE